MKEEIEILNKLAKKLCPDLPLEFTACPNPPDEKQSWLSSPCNLILRDSLVFTVHEVRECEGEMLFKARLTALLYRMAEAVKSNNSN